MLKPGNKLRGRYLIVRNIGGGGMGTVYLAEDVRLAGRKCAVKEMSPAQVPVQDRQWAIATFEQEAQILARLQHPGITSVNNFFAQGNKRYLVMEYVEGQALDQALEHSPGKRLPFSQALDIFAQLCQVLGYLHAQTPPVIFRDLKPGNVMLTSGGQIKLIDFGIARLFKPGQGQDTVTLGTPGYAAPEQYGGKGQTDTRADVYGLGVLFHQMLTGYDPAITPFRLPPAETLNHQVPASVAQAIVQATEHDPGRRFSSVGDFCALVNRAVKAPVPARPAGPSGQIPLKPPVSPLGKRLPWLGGVGGLVLLGLLCLVAFFAIPALSGGDDKDPGSGAHAVTVTLTRTPSPSTPTYTRKPTSTPVPIQSATPIPLPATAPSGAIRLLEPENEKEMKWGAWITFRWSWYGTVQGEQYLELRIDDQWYETITQPETGQIQVQLDKIETGRHSWSVVLMSHDNSIPLQQSSKCWFTLN